MLHFEIDPLFCNIPGKTDQLKPLVVFFCVCVCVFFFFFSVLNASSRENSWVPGVTATEQPMLLKMLHLELVFCALVFRRRVLVHDRNKLQTHYEDSKKKKKNFSRVNRLFGTGAAGVSSTYPGYRRWSILVSGWVGVTQSEVWLTHGRCPAGWSLGRLAGCQTADPASPGLGTHRLRQQTVLAASVLCCRHCRYPGTFWSQIGNVDRWWWWLLLLLFRVVFFCFVVFVSSFALIIMSLWPTQLSRQKYQWFSLSWLTGLCSLFWPKWSTGC